MSKKKVNNKVKANSNKKEKKSKLKSILILIAILAIIAIGVFFYTNRTEPSLALKQYFSYLSDKNYDAMYDLVETDM